MSAVTTDRLPSLPETEIIEPIVQCGVLYLGSAPPSPGRRGLDSVQEPLSHRYPVDGTNTARGIDSILSIYDNGIQLTFARQPHVVIFFPLSSLIYCAGLRFSIVENDQASSIDWRFTTLDSTESTESKHPPLFCAVLQRTQILTGDECHCFLTKSADAALALVRAVSEVYANLQSNIRPLRSPIFYQLDRYGRKITETTGVIYLSPAATDESLPDNAISRQVLLDPASNGFFYRTDTSIIEQWQLWDDDDLTGTRPRPPASPFGQHQGLYHDDLTNEIHKYLRHMDDEEPSNSRRSSSSSADDDDDAAAHHRHRRRSRHRSKSKPKHRSDSSDPSFSHSHTSSFDPSSIPNNINIQKPPIVIEKVVPNPMITTRQRHSIEQPGQADDDDYPLFSDTYQINERGEKVTKDGNRIVFMDVVQPNTINDDDTAELQQYQTPQSHRKRSKKIPVIDIRSIESLRRRSKSKPTRKIADNDAISLENDHLSTSDMLEIVDGYFEDFKGRKLKLDGNDAQDLLDHFELSYETKHRRRSSTNTHDHHHHHRRRRTHSTLTSGPGVNYVERASIQLKSIEPQQQQQQQMTPMVANNEHAAQCVSNMCETMINPTEPATNIPHELEPSNGVNQSTTVANTDFMSPFRYMQSSINPLLFREYRNVFSGI